MLLTTGDLIRVGRSGEADFFVPDDPILAKVHFAVARGSDSCQLFDLGSPEGLFVNGVRTAHATLRSGDRVAAGITEFVVEQFSEPCGSAYPRTVTTCVRDQLKVSGQTVYVVVDAAQDAGLLPFLQAIGLPYWSLYQGRRQEELAAVAPYLVSIADWHAGTWLLRRVWGHGDSLWLTSEEPAMEVRRHLRKYLMVQEEGCPDAVYFRFYDPAVWREFLTSCVPEELEFLFGPFSRFLVEAAVPHMACEFKLDASCRLVQTVWDYRTEDPKVLYALACRFHGELQALRGGR